MDKSWTDEILGFWFDELKPEDWYSGKPEIDAAVRERFLSRYRELLNEPPDEAQDDARAALAAIILFDQFPRNMFRGKPEAFSSDDLAVALTRNALDKGFDAEMNAAQKQFLYMPLMHSEVLADQELCVSLFKTLEKEDALKYAIEHRNIIARHGRFPHRNRVLGRDSTPEENAFLASHAGYGQ